MGSGETVVAYFDRDKLPLLSEAVGAVIQGLSACEAVQHHDRTFFMFSWESLRNPYGTGF
jgi:hypothetical protein